MKNIKLQYCILKVSIGLFNYFTNLITRLRTIYWGVSVGKNTKFRGVPIFRNLGNIYIGNNTRINSGSNINLINGNTRSAFQTNKSGVIKIGNNCGLSNCLIISNNLIVIEDYVYIGGGVSIFDNDFHSTKFNERIYKPKIIPTSPVHLKKGAFIGAHSIILKGVIIGENSVIGAGSVVSKNIPDNQIWAGNPIKFISNT